MDQFKLVLFDCRKLLPKPSIKSQCVHVPTVNQNSMSCKLRRLSDDKFQSLTRCESRRKLSKNSSLIVRHDCHNVTSTVQQVSIKIKTREAQAQSGPQSPAAAAALLVGSSDWCTVARYARVASLLSCERKLQRASRCRPTQAHSPTHNFELSSRTPRFQIAPRCTRPTTGGSVRCA